MSASPARLRSALALERNSTLLLLAIVLLAAGEELWLRFLPIHLAALGAGALVIGLYDALRTLLGAVYAWPGGILVDRLGHRRALLLFTAITLLGYFLVLVAGHWPMVIAATFLLMVWPGMSLPAAFSLVAASAPAGRHATGIALQSLVRRLPVLVVPALGGVLIDRFGTVSGVRAGVVITIAVSAVALAVLHAIRLPPPPSAVPIGSPLRLLRAAPPFLRRLLLADILVRFCERIPHAWVIFYVIDHVGRSAADFGLLTGVEMAVAMACTLPVSRLADRYGKGGFVVLTFLCFTAFPLVLLWASGFWPLVLAFVVRGAKELGEPARKALIVGSAVPELRGQTVGAYYLVRDVLVAGGALLGAALWQLGPSVNLVAAAACGLLGSVVYALGLRAAARTDGKPGRDVIVQRNP